jgi:hypothetical protein
MLDTNTLNELFFYISSCTTLPIRGPFALTTRDRTSNRTLSIGNVAVIGIVCDDFVDVDDDDNDAGGGATAVAAGASVDDVGVDDASKVASAAARTVCMVTGAADNGDNVISKWVTVAFITPTQ